MAQACHSTYTGSIDRKIMVLVSLGINARPCPKKTGGVAQVVEHLPSKCKALSPKNEKSSRYEGIGTSRKK
jgi:hypothetical protein